MSSKLSKTDIISLFKRGIMFNIELPYFTTIQSSRNTKNAAAINGGSKGLFILNNQRERQIEILTEVKFTPKGIILKNAKGEGHHLLIQYKYIKEAKIKRHKIIIKLVNNLEFVFKTGLLVRTGMKKAGTNSETVLQIFYEFITKDYQHYYSF